LGCEGNDSGKLVAIFMGHNLQQQGLAVIKLAVIKLAVVALLASCRKLSLRLINGTKSHSIIAGD